MVGISGDGVCPILTAKGVVVRLDGAHGGSKWFGAARHCCSATIIWSALSPFIEKTDGVEGAEMRPTRNIE